MELGMVLIQQVEPSELQILGLCGSLKQFLLLQQPLQQLHPQPLQQLHPRLSPPAPSRAPKGRHRRQPEGFSRPWKANPRTGLLPPLVNMSATEFFLKILRLLIKGT